MVWLICAAAFILLVIAAFAFILYKVYEYAFNGTTAAYELVSTISVVNESIYSIYNPITATRFFFGKGIRGELRLSGTVTKLDYNALAGCTSLEYITMPASVKYIGPSAFAGCTAFTDIDYYGTISTWKAIEKVEGWDTDSPDFLVFGDDGPCDKEGNPVDPF